MAKDELLITPDEADEIVQVNSGVVVKTRTPLLMIVGILMIVALTMIIMIVLSLRGVKTGLGTEITNTNLQLPN